MKSLLLPIALFLSFGLQAQDTLNPVVIASSGDVFQSNNYILSFTLGEAVIETFDSSGYILTQGFHQTKIDSVVAVSDTHFDGEVKLFPNPTGGLLNIDIKFQRATDIEISLYDLSGRMAGPSIRHSLQAGLLEINMQPYPAGQYFLQILDNTHQQKKTFKIIKK